MRDKSIALNRQAREQQGERTRLSPRSQNDCALRLSWHHNSTIRGSHLHFTRLLQTMSWRGRQLAGGGGRLACRLEECPTRETRIARYQYVGTMKEKCHDEARTSFCFYRAYDISEKRWRMGADRHFLVYRNSISIDDGFLGFKCGSLLTLNKNIKIDCFNILSPIMAELHVQGPLSKS